MPYTILLSLDTVGASILNVDLYNCTGDTLGNVSGCTITGNTLTNYTLMSGYSNILKRDFPKYVIIPDGTYYIKAVPSNLNNGGCVLSDISPIRIQMPTTPTPTPTTTPTAVPTATPTNTNTPVPTDTPTPLPATATPSPTPLPATATPSPTPTNTTAPAGATYTPTPTSTATPIVNDILMYSGTSVGAACSNIVDLNYYYVGSFGTETVLYTDSGLVDKAPGTVGAPRYYRYGTDVYSVNDSEGTLNAPVGCPTPTPTPIPSFTFNLYASETDAAVACAGGDTESGPYHQFVITGNTTNFCTSTSFTCDFITSNDFSQFWVSDGTNSRSLTRTGGASSETASPDGACVTCTGSSTSTPLPSTPTPTGLPATATPSGVTYDYYTADVFACTNCVESIDTILVGFVAGSSVTLNRFYIPIGGPDTNSYRVVETATGPGPAFILTTSYGSFGTCLLACGGS